jgi:predicted DCC family thiol-disulfide oxidoreductase YuxK
VNGDQLPKIQKQLEPILLFNDECAVCRHIGHWVQRSAQSKSGETSIIVQPIGDDPERLRSLNPDLDIWDAYATIHVLMPDGSMRLGGEAVAEVLRSLPNTKWFARSFATTIFGFRPCQVLLNTAYAILADVRPLFGCESCGQPRIWLRPIESLNKWAKMLIDGSRHPSPTPHFSWLSATRRRPLEASGEPIPQARRF